MKLKIFVQLILSMLVLCFSAQQRTQAQSVYDYPSEIPVWNGTNTLVARPVDNDVEIWESGASSPILIVSGHAERVTSVAWNPLIAEHLVTGSVDGTVKVWDIESGELLFTYSGHDSAVTGVSYTPDGSQIISMSAQSASDFHVIDATTFDVLFIRNGGTPDVIAFTDDGTRLMYIAGGQIHIWDGLTFEHTSAFYTGSMASDADLDPNNHMVSARWNPDANQIVTGNAGGSVYLWNVTENSIEPATILIATPHYDPEGMTNVLQTWVRDVTFSGDGERILAASSDGTLRVWDTETFEELDTMQIESFIQAGWNSDGTQLFIIDMDGEAHFIDTGDLATGHVS